MSRIGTQKRRMVEFKEQRPDTALEAQTVSLRDKLEGPRTTKSPEAGRARKPGEPVDAQRTIDRQRDDSVESIEWQSRQHHVVRPILGPWWRVT